MAMNGKLSKVLVVKNRPLIDTCKTNTTLAMVLSERTDAIIFIIVKMKWSLIRTDTMFFFFISFKNKSHNSMSFVLFRPKH